MKHLGQFQMSCRQAANERSFDIYGFTFSSADTLGTLTINNAIWEKPKRDDSGWIVNAILLSIFTTAKTGADVSETLAGISESV
jgi:hypothetical protein|tara:strand:- start:30 stop:281 length:252 start_codon:yes stop_codon:yes gene_type:complete